MSDLNDQSYITHSGWLCRLREKPWIRKINGKLTSPWFVMLIALLTVASNVFSLELVVYTVFILIGLYISLLGDDFLPLMSLVFCCYIAPSVGNNPGISEDSVFYPENGGVYLLVLLMIFVLSVIIRLVFDREIGGKAFLTAQRKLLPGILLLGGAYLLSGVGSGYYFDHDLNNLLFGFLQFLSIFLMYWFFTGAVRWKVARKDFLAWVGFGAGIVLLLEVANIYRLEDVIVDGVIQLSRIKTGWGNANNIGAMLAMMIPFAYYLACRRRNGWLYNLLGTVMLLGVVFTCSRASILGAAFAYVSAFCLSLYKSGRRRANIAAHIVTAVSIAGFVVLFREPLGHLFEMLLNKGLNPSHRDTIYLEGLKQFLKYPLFGGTFYPIDFAPFEWSTVEGFTAFFPPRWHNTIVQLMACSGLAGLGAYCYHRYQTVKLFVGKRRTYTSFIGLSLAALLIMSLLDCHMFNIGPVLFYSMGLAFAEKCESFTVV